MKHLLILKAALRQQSIQSHVNVHDRSLNHKRYGFHICLFAPARQESEVKSVLQDNRNV